MGLLVRAQWNAGIRLHSARGEGVRLIQHSPIFVEEKYVVVVAAHHKNLPIQWKRNIELRSRNANTVPRGLSIMCWGSTLTAF